MLSKCSGNLFKVLFVKKNELLIYEELSNPNLLEVIRIHEQINHKRALNELVNSRDIHIKTISYKEAINRVSSFIGIKDSDRLSLDAMGRIRNKVTHFGIYREIDFHEIIGTINNTIEFIIENLFPTFMSDRTEYLNLDELITKIKETLELARYQEHSYWSGYFGEEFKDLNELIDEVKNDNEFQVFLEQNRMEMFIERDFHIDSSAFNIFIFDDDEDKSLEFYTVNYPSLNITLMKDNQDRVCAYIDHYYNLLNEDDKAIYECSRLTEISSGNFDFFGSKKQFKKKKYNSNTLKSILKKSILES
ncbi:hypothetical protein [Paenibacillus sp. BJ-4]|uniref:hypothetical protein n=1 Tax=Paenibacillus sp. BJ-4 TaxID=2878097 RepID=UPI001CF0653D|nr:hypothetical protein [Paenibacillus sp. BJ-4]